jgi:hypothetical protein
MCTHIIYIYILYIHIYIYIYIYISYTHTHTHTYIGVSIKPSAPLRVGRRRGAALEQEDSAQEGMGGGVTLGGGVQGDKPEDDVHARKEEGVVGGVTLGGVAARRRGGEEDAAVRRREEEEDAAEEEEREQEHVGLSSFDQVNPTCTCFTSTKVVFLVY